MSRLKTLQPAVRMIARTVSKALERPRGANARGYTYRWQQYRKRWLEQHPLCGDTLNGSSDEWSECARRKRVTLGTDVDHIQRVTGPDDERFWDQTNHETLCHTCHSLKTARESHGYTTAGGGSKVSFLSGT